MKKLFSLLFIFPLFTAAQDKPLLAEGVSPGLYITHKVEPKENFYSIGRIYNISPREIAPFNNLQLENGLSLGQVIRIPLSASNFFQSGNADADEVFVPLYHIVASKEGLYRIAVNYNDLPLENLKQWNNIRGDAVKNGTKLIVGYLKVKKEQSYLARNGVGNTINAKLIAQAKTVTETTPLPVKADTPLVVKATDNNKAVVAEDVKKEPVKKVKESENTKLPEVNGKNITGGAFKSLFESQFKNAEAVTEECSFGVFKSTSGWTDGKYYCLYNSATPGTIIKVASPASGKFIYAKVLDVIPDLKQNNGLLILISNAAAEDLGAGESNLTCSITYTK